MEFHPFPRLPWELRRLIWEAAIRPTGLRIAGIQTISILDTFSLECDERNNICVFLPPGNICNDESYHIAGIPSFDHSGKANASAYMWDAGLWTACRESRDAIWSRSKMDYWTETIQKRMNSFHKGKISERVWERKWRRYRQLPVIVHAPSLQDESGEHWHFVVRPYQDAFKPTAEMIELWCEEMSIFKHWYNNLGDVRFSAPMWSGASAIKNLVLEYDSSWLDNWPDDEADPYSKMAREGATPRAFVANVLLAMYRHQFECFIWLIDRGDYSLEEYKLRETRPCTFNDCNEEYIEAKSFLLDYKSAALFIEELDDLALDLSQTHEQPEPWEELNSWGEDSSRGPFDVTDHIGILVPRNKLKSRD